MIVTDMAVETLVPYARNALTPGVLWFDTASNLMKVYTGAVWIVAASSVFRSSAIETFTAFEGQTVFTISGGYDVGRVTVYRNGLRLIAGSGFTASNGATVTLAAPATAGDAIEVEKSIFILSDVWSKAESDARFLMPTSPLDGGAYEVRRRRALPHRERHPQLLPR